jgi:hypothetical protein
VPSSVCNLVWLKSLSLNGNKICQVYALDICCYIAKLTKARHPAPDLHFSFRKTYWKTARPFRTYPCMTTRSRWTIFKCSMIVLLCDVILLWSCDVLTVKIRQPSHEFTFGVGISFVPYPLVLTPVV